MFDYLIDHALKNVWCTPDQDLQVIFQPARITAINGVQDKVDVLWQTLSLPTKKERYHVYQIGQIHPTLLGLFPERGVWRTLANVANLEKLVVDLYVKRGIQLPRTESYVLINRDQNVLIAVKIQPRIEVNLNTEPLFVRLYSNAFFDSDRAIHDSYNDLITVGGGKVTTADQIPKWQRTVRELREKPGLTNTYVNGRLVDAFNPINAKVGDIVEWVYDSTVLRVVEFPVKDLQTFNSIIDGKRKYLLHYPESNNNTIEYRDDIDVYLVRYDPSKAGAFEGVYYHKNVEDAVRMVTHKDYAIPVAYVNGYVNDSQGRWLDVKDLTVRLISRKSGYDRPLVNEHHRIRELYKLDEQDVLKAMLGIDSTVPEWRADQLELSGYTKIMRSRGLDVNRQMVQDAYGYNAIAKLVGETPAIVFNAAGAKVVNLPYGLRINATMYEFDFQGKLLGYYYHSMGDQYFPVNPGCTLVEGIVGKGGLEQDTVFGSAPRLNLQQNYRFYTCDIKAGVATEIWKDVTGSGDYDIVDGQVVWNIDTTRKYTQIKGDAKFLAYTYKMTPTDGLLRFSLNATETHAGVKKTRVLNLPVGKLELWLNGYQLIENLDYFVVWPQVVICNKSFWKTGEQEITVRGTGFCTADFKRELPDEIGFVQYGQLSRNTRFNVRDDKVMHMVVGGKIFRREDLTFAEDVAEFVASDKIPNGTPYAIDDIVVPLRGLTDEDTYSLRAKSQVVDQEIEDYLTLKHPEPAYELPNIIPERYVIHSPFATKVLMDLKSGQLGGEKIQGQYADSLILSMLKSYEYLLAYEPARKTEIDDRYVVIYPHPFEGVQELDIYQYNFFKRAVKLYLKDRVNISHFVKIGD